MSAKQASVGLFTLGVASADDYLLPHPRLGFPVILLVRKVLIRAFELLREQNFNLADALEDQVTTALRSTIENNLRQNGSVRGFNRQHYDTVGRQGQCANYDGTRINKTPDLCFKLRDDGEEPLPVLSEHYALFVECKPVDSTHAAGGRYCDDGLCRFVDGDYAWAMEEGMMLAYVRDGRTISRHLVPAMRTQERIKDLQTAQLPQQVDGTGASAVELAEAVHVSHHRRGFPWPDNKGAATDIVIYHLWHDCT